MTFEDVAVGYELTQSGVSLTLAAQTVGVSRWRLRKAIGQCLVVGRYAQALAWVRPVRKAVSRVRACTPVELRHPPLSQANRDEVQARRIAAGLRGETKFTVPLACPHGHFVRYTSNGKCSQCQLDRKSRK